MSRHTSTRDRIENLDPNLEWRRVESLMKHLGAELSEGSGSSVRIALRGRKLVVHRPHPRRECGRGLVKRVRKLLTEIGEL